MRDKRVKPSLRMNEKEVARERERDRGDPQRWPFIYTTARY